MSTTRKKVLWVDDEIEFLRSHIMFLETRGYSVTPVFNGDDALHILGEQPRGFDIVLLDEQMPGKDGLTVLEEIKDSIPDLPVVMVTKSEEEQVMEDALGMKIDGYLTKPVNPSQILSVCKRLLDSKQIISSQIQQRIIRSIADMRTTLHSPLDISTWMSVYENMVKWDFQLEEVENEGLRQAHTGQKSDTNALFANYYMENCLKWMSGESDPPLMTPGVVESVLVPLLNKGEKVFFIVFDCLRLDQYCAIEPLLKKFFDVDRRLYLATIPSTTAFTRYMLFGGAYADDIASNYPALWNGRESATDEDECFEEVLLRDRLNSAGLKLDGDMVHLTIGDRQASQALLGTLGSLRGKRLVSVDVNSVDMLLQSRESSAVIQEMVSDENAFRRLTYSWFRYSNIYQILQDLCRERCTVVLTTGNGSVLCTRGTEIYGDPESGKNLRYRIGEKVACDERHALFISEPARFRLPSPGPDTVGIVLKENYYFIQHDKFENYQKQYMNTFQHGGISIEELIVPIAVMTPK